MIRRLTLNKMLFLITGLLSLLAGLVGVFRTSIYATVMDPQYMPGVFTQDLLVILAAMVMIVLAIRMKPDDYRTAIIILGLMGFLFYAYGIYAIEQVYTSFYLLYLAILALSFYALLTCMASLNQAAIEALYLPSAIRYAAAGYGVLIAVMFNVIWIGQLLPYLRTSERIEYTFSVYIIDLVFIMPAFVIAAILALRKRAVGVVGLPALFILGVGILSPLALAELVKPSRYGAPFVPADFWLFGVLSLLFLIFAMVYLTALQPSKPVDG